MKNLHGIILLAAVAVLAGCGILNQKSPEAIAEEQKTEKLVQDKLDSKQFTVNVNYMMPTKGGSKAVNGAYSLTIDGDSIDSYLPYIGGATSVPYGGGKGLTFKDKITQYTDSGWEKDQRKISATTENGEDTLTYNITVFKNGSASIIVTSRNRDTISYRGLLDME